MRSAVACRYRLPHAIAAVPDCAKRERHVPVVVLPRERVPAFIQHDGPIVSKDARILPAGHAARLNLSVCVLSLNVGIHVSIIVKQDTCQLFNVKVTGKVARGLPNTGVFHFLCGLVCAFSLAPLLGCCQLVRL